MVHFWYLYSKYVDSFCEMTCIRAPWVLCGNFKLMYCQDVSNKARGENGIKYSNRLDGKRDYTATVFWYCSNHLFHCLSTVNFGEDFFFKVSNSSYSTKRHCSYSNYSFLGLPFVFFFSFIYIVILTQQISQYFHNYWGVNFL